MSTKSSMISKFVRVVDSGHRRFGQYGRVVNRPDTPGYVNVRYQDGMTYTIRETFLVIVGEDF